MRKNFYRLIAYYLSIFVIMIGIIQLTPLLILPFYPDEISYVSCFLIPGLASIVIGLLVGQLLKGKTEIVKLEKNYDSILIVMIWLSAILISTVPWMLKGDYNFTQAAFEMTSGFSTTGLSVVDVEATPHVFLMFRSITLFVGGVGLVLIITSAFSDKYGLNLYNAEGHTDRLMPNLAKSARLILSIYSTYILGGAIFYILFGMPVFDAINTAIAAVSTGGFSVLNDSIHGYHSLPIEIVTIVLMMLGQTSFILHLALIKKKFGRIFNHCETKFFIILAVIFIPLMFINLQQTGYSSGFGETLRISVFQFVTCLTTTGFISVPTLVGLPSGFATIMILMMLIGGDLESTGGGIKQYRVIVVLKGILQEIKNTVRTYKTVTTDFITRGGKRSELTSSEVSSMSSYILFYLILFFTGSMIFTLYGNNLQDSMFEFASAISTVGLSVGITNYNAPAVILWTANIGMFLGRLELMVVFQAMLRVTKDVIKKENI